MPRTYLVFGDIEDKLDVLRVECTFRKLIEKYGRKANMMKWKEQLNGDCPKRDAHKRVFITASADEGSGPDG
jgi:hypothetical protein